MQKAMVCRDVVSLRIINQPLIANVRGVILMGSRNGYSQRKSCGHVVVRQLPWRWIDTVSGLLSITADSTPGNRHRKNVNNLIKTINCCISNSKAPYKAKVHTERRKKYDSHAYFFRDFLLVRRIALNLWVRAVHRHTSSNTDISSHAPRGKTTYAS